MKINYLILLLPLIALQSCCFWTEDCDTEEPPFEVASDYEPIIITRSQLIESVKLEKPRAVVNSGKIYVQGDLLFVNEKYEGFHVYENSNPENPAKIQFLKALGATDLATRDNTIYINQATDLVSLNYDTAARAISVTKRIEDTFPKDRTSPDNIWYYDSLKKDEIIIGWRLKK